MSDTPINTSTCVVCENAFSPAELDQIERLGDGLVLNKAALADDAWTQDARPEETRITRTAWIGHAQESRWLYRRIHGIMHTANAQAYRFDLTGFSESFQYTVYHGSEGGHYDWHVDLGPQTTPRKLSLSLQLTDPARYEGCDLQFHASRGIENAPRNRGTAIVFPAYTLHRVTPITAGTRKSLVVWAAGPKFK